MYRRAIRSLQTHAGSLEVLGAPVSGSDVRAYVMSGGGLRVKNWRVDLASRRCFLIFPVRGTEQRGIVSAEVKKKNGKVGGKGMGGRRWGEGWELIGGGDGIGECRWR